MPTRKIKPLFWVGDAAKAYREFPEDVQEDVGYALYLGQIGEKAVNAEPLHGFGGSSVLAIKQRHDTDTYRVIYTVAFAECVYVLHAFQKKSTRGISTNQHDIELVKKRLASAESAYNKFLEAREKEN